jgi:hypothetical protein
MTKINLLGKVSHLCDFIVFKGFDKLDMPDEWQFSEQGSLVNTQHKCLWVQLASLETNI